MIKRWAQFITESVKERKIHKLTKEDFQNFLYGMTDYNWQCNVDFCFYDELDYNPVVVKNSWGSDTGELDMSHIRGLSESVDDKTNVYDWDYYPGYFITIKNSKADDHDCTPDFLELISHLEGEGMEVLVFDSNGRIDPEMLEFNQFISWDTSESEYSIDSDIGIRVIQKEMTELTCRDVSKFYGFTSDKLGESTVYINVSISDMCRYVLDQNSTKRYEETLVEGHLDDSYYWDSDGNIV